MLTHLEALGHAKRIPGEPERWVATEEGRSELALADVAQP